MLIKQKFDCRVALASSHPDYLLIRFFKYMQRADSGETIDADIVNDHRVYRLGEAAVS